MTFATLATLPAKAILGGAIQGHYAHLDRLTIGEVELPADAVLPLHAHPHEQITYVLSGRLQFTVGHETAVLGAGMVVLIPGGVSHGAKVLTTARVIDVFTPVRDDYR
ncbi:MAG: cupin domain-containing protein [Opitutae bacterium]